MDLTDNYRTFHLTVTEYTFFSSTHGVFSGRDHMLGYRKKSLFKCLNLILLFKELKNEEEIKPMLAEGRK